MRMYDAVYRVMQMLHVAVVAADLHTVNRVDAAVPVVDIAAISVSVFASSMAREHSLPILVHHSSDVAAKIDHL
jgi:hypothetical protein